MELNKAKTLETVARSQGHSAYVVNTYSDSNGVTEYGVRFEAQDWSVLFQSDKEQNVIDYICRQSSNMH